MNQVNKIKIYLSIVAISFIQGLQYFCSPVLGQISAYYPEVNVSYVQMLVTVPTFLSIVVALTSGYLVVKVTKKQMLIFAGAVAGITGLLPLAVDSFWLLFVCRALFGIALGLATALNTAVVADFFEGDERVTAMGIQAASVGAGMTVATYLGGFLGSFGFKTAYFVNLIGFISMIVLFLCLPETGLPKSEGENTKTKITVTPKVWMYAVMITVECLFLIAFSTNIGMHVEGRFAESTKVAGYLTSAFSASQIFIGIVLGAISKVTKKFTISAAYFSFVIGGIILVAFPESLPMLLIGAIFCGFSQGMFIPTAMVGASNAVEPIATAMAAAIVTCGMCFGQVISPMVLNAISGAVFGSVSTDGVYKICIAGMLLATVVSAVILAKDKE